MTVTEDHAFDYAYRFALEMLKRIDLIEAHHVDDAIEKAVQMVAIAMAVPGAEVDEGRLARIVQ